MANQLGVAVFATALVFATSACFAETQGALPEGKPATLQQAQSIEHIGTYALLAGGASAAALAAILTDQGDGAISGCVGVNGCTAPTTTTTVTPPTTTTQTTTATRTSTTTTTGTTR